MTRYGHRTKAAQYDWLVPRHVPHISRLEGDNMTDNQMVAVWNIVMLVGLGLFLIAYPIVSDTRPDAYKRFKKALAESLILAFQYLLLFLALWLDYKWAWNIYIFMLWALTTLSTIYALAVDGLIKDDNAMPKRDSTFSPRFLMLSDIIIAFILASTGHFMYASLTLIQMELEQYIISRTRIVVQKEGI
jgi:hypothetical protein